MNRYLLSIRTFSLLAIAPLLLLTGGCGGSSSGSPGTVGQVTVGTSSLSKAQFIKQADAICKDSRDRYEKEFNEFTVQHKPGKSRADEAIWVGEVVNSILLPAYERQIDQISTLGAPSGDEQQIASFLNAEQQRLDDLQRAPAELAKSLTPFEEAAKMATSYGLTGCAKSLA